MITEHKKKRRRPLWLERGLAWVLAAGVALVRCLPQRLALLLARILGRSIYFFCGPRFLGVDRHLRLAFGPNLSVPRQRELARGFWIHLCQGLVESVLLSKWNAGNCARFLDTSELDRLRTLKKSDKGLLLVSGHLGSWEVGPYALALLGHPVCLLHNPGTVAPIFEYLKRQRERSGMRVISKFEHPWALKKLLDKGAWLCIAADLNAGRRGTFVPFFGVAASSYLTPAVLHQITGCPIVVLTTARMPDGRHRVRIWKMIEREIAAGASSGAPEDRQEELLRITREIHAALEDAIRTYPEQWLWNYRRWRSRPAGEILDNEGWPPRLAEYQKAPTP